ncbi:hypothetical protein LC605_31095 [Nostoc sp. CHAB 5836]|uniref:hypothetical protein n=1 Tax=Nostoc sp. CHAB 5836 TaxID=2780404 RepID=UPI001E29905B|nr:hypothetical protein [Nostoc sp. CHAB 5836]MCC5619430.1 hypothetical protein [Nostoc sp. CHAB 5836]
MPLIKFTRVEVLQPREFCRIFFGISHLSTEDIVEYESESGYRKKCVKLLAKVTGRGERTVRSWGAGIKFEKMPECYKLTLAYALKATQLDAKKYAA